MPVRVKFIDFEDVKNGALRDADVLINAGRAGDAWSGGDAWKSPEVISEVTRFVYEGGSLIGVGEPSAAEGGDTRFALAHILGVDREAIREDYFLTNRVNEPRGDKAYRIMMEQGFDEAAANYIRDSYLAKPEYLDAAYEVIDGMFGGMENYLMKGLELEPEWIETFREQVLE